MTFSQVFLKGDNYKNTFIIIYNITIMSFVYVDKQHDFKIEFLKQNYILTNVIEVA